jgi:hypothetical protein
MLELEALEEDSEPFLDSALYTVRQGRGAVQVKSAHPLASFR